MMLLYTVSLVIWVLMKIISGNWKILYNFTTLKIYPDFKKNNLFINYS